MDLATILPLLLGIAWLLPLASFAAIVLLGPRMGKAGESAKYVATGAIVGSFVASLMAFLLWLGAYGGSLGAHAAHHEGGNHESHEGESQAAEADHHAAAFADGALRPVALLLQEKARAEEPAAGEPEESGDEHEAAPPVYAGDWYVLARFGDLKLSIGYYIDALTVSMFCMVSLIASCIHFYSIGYMHEELHDVTDHEVTLADGAHLHRRGRFHRFFQYLSLFSFSMLGLVVAGNVFMVFIFWELVGICSYFLIGFYIERKSASNAANKAFIVNRIGDFGMIIGMMALFGSLGTFDLGTVDGRPGIFAQVRSPENEFRIQAPDGMVIASASNEVAAVGTSKPIDAEQIEAWRTGPQRHGYWLLVVAGLGIFCGCVGKSAQFPLHVWLPDAMEGPTPVSALVHSATMVAAGVYLVGRFFPAFTPEVLLVIAYTGCITLFLAATIAITATDIKRVLAYSTVSQLGYMMLALGMGAWVAGLFHLMTHAFFKSLLFLCSGSVIHACHTNEMPKMGGLRHKMPYTAYTMLAGCLAIIGAGIPLVGIGFSGYYSKDAIIAQAYSFWGANSPHGAIFFAAAAGGASITAFYMFRLWFMTFAGPPRDHHIHEHAHESPKVMYVPLIVLAVFAVGVGWTVPGLGLSVTNLLEQARAPGEVGAGVLNAELAYPPEFESHAHNVHVVASLVAFSTAGGGFLLALMFYGLRVLDPEEVRRKFGFLYRFLINKWWFDELYDFIFVRPVHAVSRLIAQGMDKRLIDGFIDRLARGVVSISHFDDAIDRIFVDGAVNLLARWTFATGIALRRVQTGRLREYVMFIVVATIVLTFLMQWALAGN